MPTDKNWQTLLERHTMSANLSRALNRTPMRNSHAAVGLLRWLMCLCVDFALDEDAVSTYARYVYIVGGSAGVFAVVVKSFTNPHRPAAPEFYIASFSNSSYTSMIGSSHARRTKSKEILLGPLHRNQQQLQIPN